MKKTLAVFAFILCLFAGKTFGQNIYPSNVTASGPIPWADITAPLYGARCDGSTDDTAAFNAAIAAVTNGGTVYVPPSANGCVIAGALVFPNDGASPIPHMKTLRIAGAGAGGLGDAVQGACNGGSILNMTYNAPHAKILLLAAGKLEISGICFEDTNTDGVPFIIDINTILQAHHNQFYGNCSDSTKQNVFILGGLLTTSGNTYNNYFFGYGTEIDNNQADCTGQFVLGQNQYNGVNIISNHIFAHAGNSTHGAIEINPGSGGTAADAGLIIGNLIEVGGFKYGINVVQNTTYLHVISNPCYDSSVTTTACVNIASSAGNLGNLVIDSNPDLAGSFPSPSTVTTSDQMMGNGQYFAAVGSATSAAYGAAGYASAAGMYFVSAATCLTGAATGYMCFSYDWLGDVALINAGGIAWSSTSSPIGTKDTGVNKNNPGIVCISNGSSGSDCSGTINYPYHEGAHGAITGNSADQNLFTGYTIPANTIRAGKGVRVSCVWFHTTGTTSTAYKVLIGGTAVANNSSTGVDNSQIEYQSVELWNNAGVQNAQSAETTIGLRTANVASVALNLIGKEIGTTSINFANSQTVNCSFNVANTNQVTPESMKVEFLQ